MRCTPREAVPGRPERWIVGQASIREWSNEGHAPQIKNYMLHTQEPRRESLGKTSSMKRR